MKGESNLNPIKKIKKNYTWEPRGKKKPRGFLNFPRDLKMGFEEIYPRGIFIDFEESSSRNYLLEDLVPRGMFLFLEEHKPKH